MASVAVGTDVSNYSFQHLMDLDITRPKAIVEGFICERQNGLLMGRFGIGKTMLGTQLGLHLAIGRDFLGRKIPRPFKTQFIDCENDLGDIKERVSKQAVAMNFTDAERSLLQRNWFYATANDPTSALYGMRLDLEKEDEFSGLTTLVQEVEPEVLIIDNLGLVTKGDLKEPEEAKTFYSNLGHLRMQTEALRNGGIITMHHFTKPGERGNLEISLAECSFRVDISCTGQVGDC